MCGYVSYTQDAHVASSPDEKLIEMTKRGTTHKVLQYLAYGTHLILLELFGPADSESDSDPIRMLKRKYHRRPYA